MRPRHQKLQRHLVFHRRKNLWADFMHKKYGDGNRKTLNYSSHIWSMVKPKLQVIAENSTWIIGNGQIKANLNWINNKNIKINHLGFVQNFIEQTDLIQLPGGNDNIRNHIKLISSTMDKNCPYTLVWKLDMFGKFSIISLKRILHPRVTDVWWGNKILYPSCLFWKVMHNALPTDLNWSPSSRSSYKHYWPFSKPHRLLI